MYIVVFLQRWDDLSHTHSGLQVDGVSAKNLALIALLFAVLQHHHALEVPPTAVYYCNIIGGGVGMFGGAKPDWLLSIVFYLTHNPPRYKKWLERNYIILFTWICISLVSTGDVDCWLNFPPGICWLLHFWSFSGLAVMMFEGIFTTYVINAVFYIPFSTFLIIPALNTT